MSVAQLQSLMSDMCLELKLLRVYKLLSLHDHQ